MRTTSIIVTPQSPFPTFSLSLPSHLPLSTLSVVLAPLCPVEQQVLSLRSGRVLPSSVALSDVFNDGAPLFVRLAVRLPGGKGGFASQLRAQGGRMSSNKATNNDSCRDLNGRRLATIKEAKKLADYIQGAGQRDEAEKRRLKERQEELEQEIKRLDASGAGAKRRLEDSKYVEESKEVVEGVRDAVKLAMLKKRKKAKLSPDPDASALIEATPEVTVVESTSAEASSTDEATIEKTEKAQKTTEKESKVSEKRAGKRAAATRA